jgi:lysylphosphatidylglycerol synthetase-like protein (DUF2156 family)
MNALALHPLALHPSGFLALSPKNQRFALAGEPGFIAYRDHGRHRFSLGGAPSQKLLAAFVEAGEHEGRRVVAVQVRAEQVGLFREAGFRVNQLGTSYSLSLDGFHLGGGARMKLRQKVKRARALGLRVREHEGGLDELQRISAAWLRKKGGRELDFLVGELRLDGRRVFVVEAPGGERLGFITYVPAPGGWLHDLTRRVPEAPPGTMELCNAEAIERFRREGARWLHFGLTPFVVDEKEPEGGSRILGWLIRALYRWGAAIYPAQSQEAYKLKWAPDVIEREYVAARPLSARAVFDFLRLTRSL